MADPIEPHLSALSSPDPARRLAAAAALEQALQAEQESGRTDWEPLTARLLPVLIRGLGDPEKGVQVHTANCLQLLARHSGAVIPALRQAMGGTNRRRAWGAALVSARLGLWLPEMRHALSDAMSAQDRDLRWAAAQLALALGWSHPEAVEMVVETLQSPDPTARKMAAYCLGGMGAYTAVEAPLTGALRDPHREVRRAALLALNRLPSLSPEAIRQMALLRFDPDPQVRRTAEAVTGRRR
ncbi:MAG TPA: HEAT repeat domain-containing protein [Symbiobacteriaceae bacterium]